MLYYCDNSCIGPLYDIYLPTSLYIGSIRAQHHSCVSERRL